MSLRPFDFSDGLMPFGADGFVIPVNRKCDPTLNVPAVAAD
jgi:hypothetical protein